MYLKGHEKDSDVQKTKYNLYKTVSNSFVSVSFRVWTVYSSIHVISTPNKHPIAAFIFV